VILRAKQVAAREIRIERGRVAGAVLEDGAAVS
jgi:hypothetical protein